VTDSNGNSGTKSQDVVVGAGVAPHAAFTSSPTTPLTGQAVNFNGGISTAGSGHSIVRYDWDLGDGTTASGVTISHTYTVAGSYSVTLTVTDDAGQTSQATNGVTVGSPSGGSGAPTATFTFSPAAPAVGAPVNFNASTSAAGTGHRIASYAWTFGDGTTGAGVTLTHAYASAGSFSVQLTVTDEIGQSTTSSTQTVTPGGAPAPTANFTFSPASPGRFDQVVFDASSSTTAQGQTIVDVAWNFGDGTAVVHCPGDPACVVGAPPTNRVSQHTYTTNQTWTVNLVVTDSAGRSSVPSKAIQVTVALADPTVVATASPSSTKGPVVVFFNSDATTYFPDASGPASYSWSFGDGGTSVLANPSHPYPANLGTTNVIYNVTLSITDTKGRTGVGATTVTITP
jgi:PKD repeat protein